MMCLKGMSYRKVADIIGVSYVSVYNWFKELSNEFIDSDLVYKTASYEAVEIDEIWHFCKKN